MPAIAAVCRRRFGLPDGAGIKPALTASTGSRSHPNPPVPFTGSSGGPGAGLTLSSPRWWGQAAQGHRAPGMGCPPCLQCQTTAQHWHEASRTQRPRPKHILAARSGQTVPATSRATRGQLRGPRCPPAPLWAGTQPLVHRCCGYRTPTHCSLHRGVPAGSGTHGWELPSTSVPLFPTPLSHPTAEAQAAPGPPLSPTHLLGGERHADAVLLDEHGGTGRVGRTGVRWRRRRWRGHSSFWGDPGVGGGVRRERWGTARGSLPRSHPITPRSRRPPRSRHR